MKQAPKTRARTFFAPLIATLMLALSLVVVTGSAATADDEFNFYICHATGNETAIEDVRNWVVNRPSNLGQFSGHVGTTNTTEGNHQNSLDIIPPIPALDFPGQNWTAYGREVYYNLNKQGVGCNVPDVTPTAPPTRDGCAPNDVVWDWSTTAADRDTVHDGAGFDWTYDANTNSWSVAPQPGYVFPQNTVTTFNLPADTADTCDKEATPTAPPTTDGCAPGDVAWGWSTTNAPSTENDTVEFNWTYHANTNSWSVAPQPGYFFPPNAVTTFNLPGDTADTCDKEVRPTRPPTTDGCAPGDVAWNWSTTAADRNTVHDGSGFDWTYDADSNSWSVAPQSGYVFPENAVTTFNLPADYADTCDEEVRPTRPPTTDGCAPGDVAWNWSTTDTDRNTVHDGSGFDWTYDTGSNSWSVAPQSGYTFPPNTVTTFNLPADYADTCPPPPPPAPLQLTENAEGCSLAAIGFPDSHGTAVRTGVQEYILVGTQYVLEPLSDVLWGAWTVTEYSDTEYFEKCASGQPDPIIREVAGVQTDCEMNGTTYTIQTFTTEYVWDTEGLAWVLGPETGPVVTEEFIPFGGEVPEECIEEEPEVKGDQAQVINHQLPEVKGEQAVAPGVPTAVDAGIGAEESPLGSGRNPLWLLAVGGGLGLLGSAGLRRRATASR